LIGILNNTQMKKNTIALFVTINIITSSMVFITITTSAAQTTISEYLFEFDNLHLTEVDVNGKYIKVELEECFPTSDVGEPEIPIYVAQIAIPFDKRIKNVDVISIESEEIKLDYPVIPMQQIVPLSFGKTAPFEYDMEIYGQDSPVFGNLFNATTSLGYSKGFPILSVQMYPIDYNPSQNIITFHKTMRVKITYEKIYLTWEIEYNEFLRSTPEDVEYVKEIVDNPDEVLGYNPPYQPFGDEYPGGICDSADTYEYVIITNNLLNDTEGFNYNWSDFLVHRESFTGLHGNKVTVENIEACQDYWDETNSTFNDTQAKIREFCKDAYLDWDTQYILIGGDWDDDGTPQIVPYRDFLCGYGNTGNGVYACDLYYSNLDGDWNIDENYWGGYVSTYGHDIYSELKIGRLTVGTAEEISNAIEKIMWYDLYSDNDFLQNVTFFGGNLGWPITSMDYMEDIRNGTGDYVFDTDGFVQWNERCC